MERKNIKRNSTRKSKDLVPLGPGVGYSGRVHMPTGNLTNYEHRLIGMGLY